MDNSTIVLMTDFGYSDVFVAQMKGIIDRINPNVRVIDLTHDIEPFNIKQAGFVIKNSYKYFRGGSVFICVVDPGVGSQRKPICVEAEDYIFLAPNNGLLSYVLDGLRINKIVEIDNQKYISNELSNTFHGRDIFAFVGGYITKGIKLEEFGSIFDKSQLKKLDNLRVERFANKIHGEIVYSDRFGNMVTSIHKNDLPKKYEKIEIRIGSYMLYSIRNTFSDVEVGELLAYIGSMGYLEIGIRGGSAKELLKCETDIELIWV